MDSENGIIDVPDKQHLFIISFSEIQRSELVIDFFPLYHKILSAIGNEDLSSSANCFRYRTAKKGTAIFP